MNRKPLRTPLDIAFANVLRVLEARGFELIDRDDHYGSGAESRVYQGLGMRFDLSIGRDGTFALVADSFGKRYQLSILLSALGATVDATADDDLLADRLEQDFDTIREVVNGARGFDEKYVAEYWRILGPNAVAPFTP